MVSEQDTIAAIATPPGRGGIGIVRISGPGSGSIVQRLCGRVPPPRTASLAGFRNREDKLIDNGLVLYFPAPHSYTGDTVVELQGHGGAMVLDQLLERVLELGARLAQPGEFTKRAYLNDRIDLAQAEAVSDLIDASSHKAARAAVRSLDGEFSSRIQAILEQLTGLRMYVESAIDFPEEEIDFLREGQVEEKTRRLFESMNALIEVAGQGRLLRDGMTVVIAGKPNAGKSSLLNALSGSDSAIVTHIPGTTRDVLRESINIDGMPLNIVDTAGLRESDDPVEQEGVRRARAQIARADCILYVIDASLQEPEPDAHEPGEKPCNRIRVYNKIDLAGIPPGEGSRAGQTCYFISAISGQGLEGLRKALKKLAGYDSASEGIFIARRRHLDALERARSSTARGLAALCTAGAGELLAEDLLQAQNAMGEITGEFTSDDLLGKIFSTFCIGK